MGRNLTAVDATCARIMGIDPFRVKYLAAADSLLGPVASVHIPQRGAAVTSMQSDFQLLKQIPAQRALKRMSGIHTVQPFHSNLMKSDLAQYINRGWAGKPNRHFPCRIKVDLRFENNDFFTLTAKK